MEMRVYGAQATCPSCVGAPSSEETYSWLKAVIERKYEVPVTFRYIDFEKDERDAFVEALEADEYFYPLVVLDGEVIDEGYVRLKKITDAIDAKLGQTS
ncbi:DUF1462 family protein [Exiguobacterium flavidum]|uniref:DUF1462 family protein n=1 Tax=Exiguobacterium flavidum TaxID=2184695 RepID=UPI000DF7B23D|nr:DUF1462 family protein [Exiguobacterium flavidum]